jgi:hypothetical protein
MDSTPFSYLQELQEPLLQELLQPDEEPAKGFSTPLMPKLDIFFLTSFDEHFGQSTTVLLNTSFSKFSQH